VPGSRVDNKKACNPSQGGGNYALREPIGNGQGCNDPETTDRTAINSDKPLPTVYSTPLMKYPG